MKTTRMELSNNLYSFYEGEIEVDFGGFKSNEAAIKYGEALVVQLGRAITVFKVISHVVPVVKYTEKEKNMAKILSEYLDEFVEEFGKQIDSDQERWGDTWKKRPVGDYQGRGDQEARVMERIHDYYDQYKNAGTPMPWLKIVGEAFICWVREKHPDYGEE